MLGCLDRPPETAAPVRVLNIGNHRSEAVRTLIALLEQALGRTAVVREAARPPADVEETCASIEAIGALTGFAPRDVAGRGHSAVRRLVPGVARAWQGRGINLRTRA